VCRQCGDVADVDCAVGAAPCIEPAVAAGFVIDRAEVTYWGLCPGCQAAGRDDEPATRSGSEERSSEDDGRG
jgi:Fe2+ or Zn2+ uptake regulation protein